MTQKDAAVRAAIEEIRKKIADLYETVGRADSVVAGKAADLKWETDLSQLEIEEVVEPEAAPATGTATEESPPVEEPEAVAAEVAEMPVTETEGVAEEPVNEPDTTE